MYKASSLQHSFVSFQDFLSTALFNRLKAFRRANKKPTVNPTRKPNPKPLYPSSSPFQTIRINEKTAKEHAQQAKSITFEYRKEQSQVRIESITLCCSLSKERYVWEECDVGRWMRQCQVPRVNYCQIIIKAATSVTFFFRHMMAKM